MNSNHTLQLTDKTKYRMLVGGERGIEPGHHVGRGLTKGALEYQTALCVDAESETDRSRKLKALCHEMSEAWTGTRASLAEAEAASSAPVEEGELTASENSVQIGLTKEKREPVEFVYKDMNGCIITGTDKGGKSSIIGMIAKALNDDADTKLYVYEQKPFIEKFCPNAVIMHTPEEADEVIAKLEAEYSERDEDSTGRIVLCLDDFYDFYLGISEESADILEAFALDGADKGMYMYVACSSAGVGALGYNHVPLFVQLTKGGNAIIAGGSLGDYSEIKELHRENSDMLFDEHEGCMIHDRKLIPMMFGKP